MHTGTVDVDVAIKQVWNGDGSCLKVPSNRGIDPARRLSLSDFRWVTSNYSGDMIISEERTVWFSQYKLRWVLCFHFKLIEQKLISTEPRWPYTGFSKRVCATHGTNSTNTFFTSLVCSPYSDLKVYLPLRRPELTCVSGSVFINQLLLFNEALKLQETHRFAGAFTPSLPVIKADPHHRERFGENAALFFLIVSLWPIVQEKHIMTTRTCASFWAIMWKELQEKVHATYWNNEIFIKYTKAHLMVKISLSYKKHEQLITVMLLETAKQYVA